MSEVEHHHPEMAEPAVADLASVFHAPVDRREHGQEDSSPATGLLVFLFSHQLAWVPPPRDLLTLADRQVDNHQRIAVRTLCVLHSQLVEKPASVRVFPPS
jgi:hypothetical protein